VPGAGLNAWAVRAADTLQQLLQRPLAQQQQAAEAGIRWAARYSVDRAIDGYIDVYQRVLAAQPSGAPSA
jgi:hypothetical protein